MMKGSLMEGWMEVVVETPTKVRGRWNPCCSGRPIEDMMRVVEMW